MPTPRGADRLLKLALAALGGLFLFRAAFLLASPYPVDYGEGTTWTYAHLLRLHGTYFLPIQEPPWIHATYPPVFPALQALLGGGLGAGRLVTLLATLAAVRALVSILRCLGVTGRRAWLAAPWLVGTPAVHEWGALDRVDMLALAFSLLAVWVAQRHQDRPGELLAAVPALLAFFTKQVAVAAPCAIGLSLLLRGRRRQALWFALAFGGPVLAVGATLEWLTGGELVRHLVVYAGFVGLRPGPVARTALVALFTFPVLLALGVRPWGSYARSPAGVYVVLALLTLAYSGKPGAAANYLIEPSAACVLVGLVGLERRLGEGGGRPERRRELSLLLLVQALVLMGPGRPLEPFELLRGGGPEARAVAALRAAPGPVLSEDLGLTLAAGKEPLLEPFQFFLLARAGLFDPAPVLERVEAGELGAILMGWRLRSLPGLEEALQGRYQLAERVGPWELWLPRPAGG